MNRHQLLSKAILNNAEIDKLRKDSMQYPHGSAAKIIRIREIGRLCDENVELSRQLNVEVKALWQTH